MNEYEFVWNLRDDIHYLLAARRVLLSHPLVEVVEEHCNATFCRLFAILMIAYIDHIFEKWHEQGLDKLN